MTVTKSREELVTAAAFMLGILAAGQTLSAEDYAAIDGEIGGLIAELMQRNIVYVPNVDAIEPQWFDALAMLLSNQCAPKFGAAKDEAARLATEDRLKVMERPTAPNQYLKTDRALRYTSRYLRGTYRG